MQGEAVRELGLEPSRRRHYAGIGDQQQRVICTEAITKEAADSCRLTRFARYYPTPRPPWRSGGYDDGTV